MPDMLRAHDTIVDYITGKTVPNIGVEEIRQHLERFLVEEKGYAKADICVGADISVNIDGNMYQSRLDLVVSAESLQFMVVKCAAGSLESRQREVLSASRIISSYQVPYSVVSDGKTAVIYNTITGKKCAEGLSKIFSHAEAKKILSEEKPVEISKSRRAKEKILFRSYDSMNVNVLRNA